jgi:hypothetical protein
LQFAVVFGREIPDATLRSEKSLWVGAFCGKGVHPFRTDRGDDEAVVELVGEER